MIRSMTGYASEFRSTPRYDVTLELKSVNSRYFEFKIKTYASLDEWENEIKAAVFEKLKRGKIDLFVKVVEKDAENFRLVVNYELARKYEAALKSLAENLGIVPDLSMKDFLSLGDSVIQVERTPGTEELRDLLLSMLGSLLEKILDMMNLEGRKTRDDVEKSLAVIESCVSKIEALYPESLEKYRAGLKDRIREMFPESGAPAGLDNGRLLMEVDMVASRTAINEEIVRLKSHLAQFRGILSGKSGGDSRKLDFIGQEMNRETNTIASKSGDYQIIENTIAIKGEIEKIREQIRNVE